jgi:phosphoglycolate phosphatase-like HAD superfamily hydrolase
VTSGVRPTVLLFDVDGTLVTTVGCGRRALEHAFGARYGQSAVLRDVGFDGMTDRAIVRAGLRALGEPAEGPRAEDAIDALLADYVPLLVREIAETPTFQLHRGVRELLDATAARPGIAVGLGTGNVRAGAEAKLAPLGVLHHFGFGGFGCDHEDRNVIVRLGAERGAARLGIAVGACRVVVIGDTPRDVAAARAIGAEAIGVGSARFSAEELVASGAVRAFANLDGPDVLAALLGDG